MEYEVDALRYDLDAFDGSAKSMVQEIAFLKKELSTFETASAKLPGYWPEGTPTAEAVNAPIKTTEAAAARTRRQINALLTQAKKLAAAADGYVSQAQAECNRRG